MLKGLVKWSVMNSKEVRSILQTIREQWSAELSLDCGFLQNKEGDIFLISRDIEKLDIERLNIESLGLYFGQLRDDGLRLSIEGSQMVGKAARNGVVGLSDTEFREWLSGSDIEKNAGTGYVIVRHNEDFAGCGRCKNGIILNFVPKARRVSNA